MTPSVTETLTSGLARCDEESWRDFHRLYFAKLHAWVAARGVAGSDAAEAVQGVYLRVLRHAKVFRRERDFEAWLGCLARCEALDCLRRVRRRSWLGERFQQWQESRRDVSGGGDGGLDEALGALSGAERALLVRHYVEGWSQEELACEQGVSVKAVESKLARVRKRLRQSMTSPGFIHPS